MKFLPVLLFAFLSMPTVNASTVLTPAWKTPAVFQGPESVVYHPGSGYLYVSNVNGAPDAVDGNGFISQLSDDGNIKTLHWLDGLNAPKGLAVRDDKLYVADINTLLVIDLNTKSVTQRYLAEEARFLNDVAIDQQGRVYVSDMMTNQIYRLKDGQFTVWLEDPRLESPNGLLVENNRLVVGSWGKMTDGFDTEVAGHLKVIDLETREIQSLGDGTAVGNLDGVEADGKGQYLVTDWMDGRLLRVSPLGHSQTLIEFDQGSADLTIMPEKNLVIIPMMLQNQVQAFGISHP